MSLIYSYRVNFTCHSVKLLGWIFFYFYVSPKMFHLLTKKKRETDILRVWYYFPCWIEFISVYPIILLYLFCLYQFSRWHSKMLRKYTDKLTWAQNSEIQIYQLSSNRNSIAGNYFFKLQIVTQFKKKPNDNTFLQADNVVTRHLYI